MTQQTRQQRPRLAAPSPAPKARRPTLLETINPFLPLAQAFLIVLIGYGLKDRFDIALRERQAGVQERQATVQSVQNMTALLTRINESKSNDYPVLQDAFAQLAMYGTDAIFPLFVLAASRSQFPPENAITGLRLLAVQHPVEVCAVLTQARQVPRSVHEIRKASLDQLTGELGCGNSRSSR